MQSIKVKIIDPIGIHARPAALTVSEASKYSSNIKVIYDGKEANLKSIMNLMSIAIKCGAEIEIQASGADEVDAIAGVKAVLETNKII